jgi:lipopolysaccharide transport system ATP-binding protein
MSSTVAIKVEGLGKLYRLGEVGTGTLSQDLNRAWARLRGKEDPFAIIGETNDQR